MKKKIFVFTALILFSAVILYLSCCEDCPTCPDEPTPPPLGHYRLYAHAASHKFIMSVDTPADTIVDSIRVDYYGYGIFLMPDGNRLLVTNTEDFRMEIYSASDLSHVGTSPQYGDYYFDASDGYGIWVSFMGDHLKTYLIDAISLTPVDSIDRPIGDGFLDTVSNYFFGCNYHDSRIIYRIDCDSWSLLDSIIVWDSDTTGRVLQPAHNWLTGDLYFHAWYNKLSYFFQYDTEADSIIKATPTTTPLGSVAISPDGRSVYMTDGGDGSHWIYPPDYIYIFDAITHQVRDLIPTYDFAGELAWPPLFGQIILTPDNRRAYVGASWNAWGNVPVISIDLLEKKIVGTIYPINGFWATSIALGPVPDNQERR